MKIEADGAGFLLGERRLKELATGVGHVHDNTAEILQILKGMLGNNQVSRNAHYQNVSEIARSINQITKAKQTSLSVTLNTGAGKTTTRSTGKNITVSTAPSVVKETSNKIQHKQTVNTNGGGVESSKGRVSGGGVKSSSASSTAGRDAKGRFVASAQGINEKVEKNSGGGRSYNWNTPDIGGIDPTVDAVRELTTLFSPAKRAFGLMGRGASWIYKRARPKRNEELPGEQKNHNDEVERHNYEERKVLRKILDAINRNQGGGLLGALARLLGTGAGLGAGGRRGQKGKDGAPGKDQGKKKTPPAVPVPDKDKVKPKAPGKFGKFLGKVPLLGALLGAGMVASDWADQDNGGRGAGIGGLAGTAIGGVVGSFAGPVGSIAGGAVGGMIGERVGQKIGDWTNTLKKDNIGGAIVNRWDDTLNGINKFIKESWNKMGLGFGFGMASKMGMGGMMLASYRRPGSGGGYGYSQDNGSTNMPRNTQEEKQNQMDVYNAMLGAGFSKSQAQALTAEVGRENGYQSKYLYGAHQDAANGKTNIGMISWQGDRAKRLYKSMSDQGFIKNGKMVRSKEALLAQAKFMRQEIENDNSYSATKKMFNDNPNADPETYAKTLGKNYIGWAYGQDKLSNGKSFDWQSHNATRRGHLKELQSKTDGPRIQQPIQAQPAKPQPKPGTNSNGAKPVFVNTAKPANKNKSLYVSNSPKPKPMAPVQYPKVIQRESSQQQQQPLMVSNQGNISQNVADRDITHAITGGLGMRTTLA